MSSAIRRALITGVTGQDGSYLAEFLLGRGYEVHGVIRRSSTIRRERIDHIKHDAEESDARFVLHYGDLSDASGLRRIIEAVEPDEVYHLGAQSHVRISFDQPEYTADVVAIGALRLFESLRDYARRTGKLVRIYQAGSSEMFGAAKPPQSEQTPFHPRSPYAVSKVAAHWYAVNYRESYGLFICNGILFNHESPRRGENFVTRKITRAVGRIKQGLQDKVYLGNLDAKRDWGFAGDYVRAMWMMLQHPTPDDFVVSTGESHSVREFVEAAFSHADLDWREHVAIDPRHYRPAEVDYLLGDSTKAREALDWKPQVTFEGLVQMMVEHDMAQAAAEKRLAESGSTLGLIGADFAGATP
jgi:GDPmannose 4,6-dehydratase